MKKRKNKAAGSKKELYPSFLHVIETDLSPLK
jgi:hypothetical protein